jgi:Lrp/AsnC family leucine-responsive transcriptional regulator
MVSEESDWGGEAGQPAAIRERHPVAGIDDIDRQLLALLQDNDRRSLAELSAEIGAAQSTLNDRIKRLVAQGIIAGFHARIDPEPVGLNLLAFVFVAWSDPKVEPVFLKKIKASPDVLECHHVTGAWNYLMKVRVGTTRDLERFLAETVKTVSGMQRTETVIVLSSAKETWALEPPK